MKFKREELSIKIGALADEAKRIRDKEQTMLYKAQLIELNALMKHKGIDKTLGPPEELANELARRLEGPYKDSNYSGIVLDKLGKKVIRKYLRAGLSKEEILALPGMQYKPRYAVTFESLHWHRKHKVRHEARHSQLALAFLRQRPYEKAEDKPNSYPNWEKIVQIAKSFSNEDIRLLTQRFEQWYQESLSYIRGRELMSKAQFRTEPLKYAA